MPKRKGLYRITLWVAIVLLFALALPTTGLLFDPVSAEQIGALEVAPLAASLAPDAPLALETPEDMRCRPYEGKTDQVLLQWNDTNDGNAPYDLYREDVSAAGWNLLTTVAAGACDDDVCQFVDTGASNSTVYRYRVQANTGGDTSSFSEVCREPLAQEDPNGIFRVFYRLVECPTFEGKTNCTQNINNGDDQNVHVMQMINTHDDFRQTYIDLGFKDYAYYQGV